MAAAGGQTFQFSFGPGGGFAFAQRGTNRPAQEPLIIEKVDVTLEDVFQRRAFPFDISVRRKQGSNLEQTKHKFNITYACWGDLKKPVYLRGKGNQSLDDAVADGDIAVRCSLVDHGQFEPCNDYDLIMRHTLSYEDALCGFDFEVPFIDANRTALRFSNRHRPSEIIQAGTVFMCRCGLPLPQTTPPQKYQVSNSSDETKYGTLYIVFDVETPDSMTTDERKMLSKRLLSQNSPVYRPPSKPEDLVQLNRAPPGVEYQLANNLHQRKAQERAQRRQFSEKNKQ